MFLTPPVFRPPSEADSFLLQVTLGCSWNRCTYCNMYVDKPFKITPDDELRAAIAAAPRSTRRVFLCDGDAMALPARRLHGTLDMLHEAFPDLQRVGIYCWPPNVRRKSDEELASLKARKLSIAYIGLESGDDVTLERIRKGCRAEEFVTASRRLQEAGFRCSIICLLGVGTRERSREHARETAKILNRIQPRYASFLTVTPVEGTVMHDEVASGNWEMITPEESLQELRWILEDLELEKTIVRANHASSYLPIGGSFPKDKASTLEMVDAALRGDISLKPEWMRGL